MLRAGETVLDNALGFDAEVTFIGTIHTPFKERGQCPRQGDAEAGPDCTITAIPELEPALAGLERFDSVEVLYWLHLARRDLLTQSPKADGAVRGTFSLRSPLRPNPIGTSRVRLIRREGTRLIVRGLDCLDGTPLIDLKPDRCSFTVQARAKGLD
ncbi:tRNA (N6-threonylcarbamoyladenosine(37)-N6)-methyltransferase TrmO [Pacificoceanicola onchidii]|uniref:tRNA (N6-threonylcarbamoyladenosine(37)-N6)-methyltransferase TrmO n=1 Tax=Pacificoceanicola onchidii TaxID=2562685 RepID=UPI0010A4285B|nr:tRNA (N6-threonylcarbamoyladenosine(37)-N6)-methyltransferase TrmO [Pacificoceanicola onchidii]